MMAYYSFRDAPLFKSVVSVVINGLSSIETFTSVRPKLIRVNTNDNSVQVHTEEQSRQCKAGSSQFTVRYDNTCVAFDTGSVMYVNTWLVSIYSAGWTLDNVLLLNNDDFLTPQHRHAVSNPDEMPLSQSAPTSKLESRLKEARDTWKKRGNQFKGRQVVTSDYFLPITQIKHDENKTDVVAMTKNSGYCSKESLIENKAAAQNERGSEIEAMITEEKFSKTSKQRLKEIYSIDVADDAFLGEDASNKLEKKPSMNSIIDNFKTKFATASLRKRGKRQSRNNSKQQSYASRLLWNRNGQWKDKWFVFDEGTLQGYKDLNTKPADVFIEVNNCSLTYYTDSHILNKLNIFKLTTASSVVHSFIAWNAENYEAWIETLSYYVIRKDVLGAPVRILSEPDSEIIPYQVDNQGTNRGDSLDSGNDGDESGLESSINSSHRRRIYRDAVNSAHKDLNDNITDKSQNDSKPYKPPLYLPLRKDSTTTTNSSNECHSPLASPLDQLPSLYPERPKSSEIEIGKPINKSLHSKHRWSMLDLTNIDKRHHEKKEHPDSLLHRTHSQQAFLLNRMQSNESVDSSLEDRISRKNSAPRYSDIEEQYNHQGERKKVVEAFREETLLRKRRNSLTLEKGQVQAAIELLTEHSKKNNKSPDIDDTERKERLFGLQNRRSVIESQIEDIDKRFVEPVDNSSKQNSLNKKLTNKLRINTSSSKLSKSPIASVHSMSIESLNSSVASSNVSRHSHQSSYDGHQDDQIPESSEIQEPILTTERLESKQNVEQQRRSQSMSAMALLEKREKRKSRDEANFVIKDFQEFSMQLMTKMNQHQVLEI